MKRSHRDKWIARLRDPKMKKVKYHYTDAVGGINTLIEGPINAPVKAVKEHYTCCCATGHFYCANIVDVRKMRKKMNVTYLCADLQRKFMDPKIHSTIVRMNDHENKTLAEIADWIEANVPVED